MASGVSARRWWIGVWIVGLLLGSLAGAVRAEEVAVPQYPDSSYAPGPGWPEGWKEPPVPSEITPETRERVEEVMARDARFKRVETRVLDPLPKWTREYPYVWAEELVPCGDTIYVYWYPDLEHTLLAFDEDLSYVAHRDSSSQCRFEQIHKIEAARTPEITKEWDRRWWAFEEQWEKARGPLEKELGGREEGTPDNIRVFYNHGDASRRFDVPAYLDETVGRVRVPIRFISELMGATVTWDDATSQVGIHFPPVTQEVSRAVPAPGYAYSDLFSTGDYFPDQSRYLIEKTTVSLPETRITLTIGQPEAVVNGEQVPLDAPPVIRSDRTMVPIRFIAERMGARVYWVGDKPAFHDYDGEISGTYQVHIFTPIYPLFEYPSWHLEHYAEKV